jgi:hypothetical protein
MGSSRVTCRALVWKLSPLIAAMEEGGPLPGGASPHEAAALLLLALGELPKPLLPAACLQRIRGAFEQQQQQPVVDAGEVVSMLFADLLSPSELATAKLLLDLLRKVSEVYNTLASTLRSLAPAHCVRVCVCVCVSVAPSDPPLLVPASRMAGGRLSGLLRLERRPGPADGRLPAARPGARSTRPGSAGEGAGHAEAAGVIAQGGNWVGVT